MGCVVDYIAGIADFIKNSFVILSLVSFVLYVHRRGWLVCWHKFVNAGILGKDQRHRVEIGGLTTPCWCALQNAIEGKNWVSAQIKRENGENAMLLEESLQMFILNQTTAQNSNYLDILTDREVSKKKLFRSRDDEFGQVLKVYFHPILDKDKDVFTVNDEHCWHYIRTPSLIAKLFGEEPTENSS